ncbi:hypothetical protein JX265_003581 [Neoarthrinium moseri]|uniref:Uncharacterized protein n=1 Tax=Neoarthrinium moseri TaxID=1658444 RepID=A0A9P9WSG8_9PEZI|nr:hypothetical protein JX265_003581 [Neoarthrinium moseri]
MSLGALTTVFTPPADCLATDGLYWVKTASTFYWLYGKPYQTSCFPDNYAPYQNNYYSPGVCPSGYVERCRSLFTGGSTTETRATCCPSVGNFVCASTSSRYTYPWGPTLGCMSVYNIDFETAFTTVEATLNGDEVAGESKSLRAPGTMMAYGIPIRRRNDDNVITSASQQTATSAGIPSSQTMATTSETAAVQATATAQGGLSAGAAAGIAVGATLGGLLLLGCIAFMFWNRRRQRRRDVATHSQGLYEYPPPPPQEYTSQYAYQQPQEQPMQEPIYTQSTGSWQPTELAGGNDGVHEVSGGYVIPEKDGTGTYR